MTPETWTAVDRYIVETLSPSDPQLEAALQASAGAGLPPISVSTAQGKFLYLLARIAGARRILEIGTLGGYSTTWLGRALPANGRLITLEFNPVHGATARKSLAAAGLDQIAEVTVGDAAASMRSMIDAGESPFDLVFIDADKGGYVKYLHLALQLSRPGTVIVADNVIRNGAVMDEHPKDDNAREAKAYNAAIAANPQLESIALPLFRNQIDGIAISRVK